MPPGPPAIPPGARLFRSHRSGRPWPTPEEQLLLEAALLTGPDALTSWSALQSATSLDRLDFAGYRLLPLVYWNLRANGMDVAAFPKLRAAYDRTWLENEMRLRRAATVAQTLSRAGIPVIALKGTALIVACYLDQGLRPMVDIDLLVPYAMASQAAGVLEASNWKSGLVRAPHAHSFSDADGFELDLHWHVLVQSSGPGADDAFWQAAIPQALRSSSVAVLCPADQLLHVCVHGAVWSPSTPLRWVADASMVLRSGQQLDWDRLLAQSRTHRVTLIMRVALEYLRDTVRVALPPEVIKELRARRVSRLERLDYATETVDPHSRGLLFALWCSLRYYIRWERGRGQWPSPLGYARSLQVASGIDHLWQLPVLGAASMVRRGWRVVKQRASSGIRPSA